MKQTSDIIRLIGRFRVTPEGIRRLAEKIEIESGDRRVILDKIYVETGNTRLTYDTIEEIVNDRIWERKATKFSLEFRENNVKYGTSKRWITIQGGGFLSNLVHVSSEQEAWTIGIVQVILKEMRHHEIFSRRVVNDLTTVVIFPVSLTLLASIAAHRWISPLLPQPMKINIMEDFDIIKWILIPICAIYISQFLRSRIIADVPKKGRYLWSVVCGIASIIGAIIGVWALFT